MDNQVVCHTGNNDFLDALNSCLTSGLGVWLDGIPQTGDQLSQYLLFRENAEWVGSFLQDESGALRGISFTDSNSGNTLLPK